MLNNAKFRKLIKKVLPALIISFLKKIINFYADESYSQEGEDMILKRYFNKKNGFYVDIGAHHPLRFSNTYKFYKLGWRGINVDAMPGSMKIFQKYRKRDINIEAAIGEEKSSIPYYSFSEPALNTFNEKLANEYTENGDIEIKNIYKIEIQPIEKILDKYLPHGVKIDFMTIDVEGFDLQVIKSNNWSKYRPTIIVIESLTETNSCQDIQNTEISKYLFEKNYKFLAKTINTYFYKNQD